jgi:hypothetical protein
VLATGSYTSPTLPLTATPTLPNPPIGCYVLESMIDRQTDRVTTVSGGTHTARSQKWNAHKILIGKRLERRICDS